MTTPPALYLVPVTLSDETVPAQVLPGPALATVCAIRDFVVENAKSARRFLSACGHPGPLASLSLRVLDEHTPEADVPALLEPVRQGRPLAVLSEAGAPAVADPGARLVAAAHEAGMRVVPLSGPSSILLALMACGLEGQRFRFAGYLPVPAAARRAALLEIEARSATERETQIFIETPYRNDAMLADILATCRNETRLAIAADLTAPTESIRMASIAQWKRGPTPPGRRPAVFLLLAKPSRGAQGDRAGSRA